MYETRVPEEEDFDRVGGVACGARRTDAVWQRREQLEPVNSYAQVVALGLSVATFQAPGYRLRTRAWVQRVLTSGACRPSRNVRGVEDGDLGGPVLLATSRPAFSVPLCGLVSL